VNYAFIVFLFLYLLALLLYCYVFSYSYILSSISMMQGANILSSIFYRWNYSCFEEYVWFVKFKYLAQIRLKYSLRSLLASIWPTKHKIYITKSIPLETLRCILSNGIFFVLCNLYYIDQIDDLGTCACLVNKDRGSTETSKEINEKKNCFSRLV
jgi:hypothetical protein